MFSHSQDWGRNSNAIALLTGRWATQWMVHQIPLHTACFLKGKATMYLHKPLDGQALLSISSVESPRWPSQVLHRSIATVFSVIVLFGSQRTSFCFLQVKNASERSGLFKTPWLVRRDSGPRIQVSHIIEELDVPNYFANIILGWTVGLSK